MRLAAPPHLVRATLLSAACTAARPALAAAPQLWIWTGDNVYGDTDDMAVLAARYASQQLALDFLGEPASEPRRTRPGMYAAYGYGPPGRRVKVILLDTRYFRDPLPARGARRDLRRRRAGRRAVAVARARAAHRGRAAAPRRE